MREDLGNAGVGEPHATGSGHEGSTAVLWTGGKDCVLALHLYESRGDRVAALVTFVPPRARFWAHPLGVMKLQALALGLPHRRYVVRPPYADGYDAALRRLRAEGYATLVSGDIGPVRGHPSWIRARAARAGLRIIAPLWSKPRIEIFRRLGASRIRPILSAVRRDRLDPSWLGRALDARSRADLLALARRGGWDGLGEQGEYHTTVLDAPLFQRRVRLEAWHRVDRGALSVLVPDRTALVGKRRLPRATGGGAASQPALGPLSFTEEGAVDSE